MTPRAAMDFIRYHGVVVESAKGLEPSFAAHVAGERISGSWWGHPKGHEIYELTQKVHDSRAVLTCTLAKGRITFIHRRLWPSFVKLASHFVEGAFDKVREVHTESGRHQRRDIAFPEWVDEHTRSVAASLANAQARDAIGVWLDRYGVANDVSANGR